MTGQRNKPPNWIEHFSPSLIAKALKSKELQMLVKKADKEYVYWDKFRFYSPPAGFSIEEAWAYLKFSRISSREETPIRTEKNKFFTFTTTKSMYQSCSLIDSNTSGFIGTQWRKPTEVQKNQLVISGLSEEAIASSQIEGANTSRKVAKEMILSNRKPRTKSEQMIINNYQVMQRLLEWKSLNLSLDMLLEIQRNITYNTLENVNDSGRLREDKDNINVVNSLTGEIVFTPPSGTLVKQELLRLIEFANRDEDEEDFIHPVIKASILHFWLAYLHPFVDGNGRTARALFYWYLLRKNYWMFQYLSVSRIIKTSKAQYDKAYVYSEIDDNDVTYFLVYKMKVILRSIEDFISHYKQKVKEQENIQKITSLLKQFNERQIGLLHYLNEHREATIDIKTHKAKYLVAYQTARTDLINLAEKGLITQMTHGKKYEYVPNTILIKNLLSKAEMQTKQDQNISI